MSERIKSDSHKLTEADITQLMREQVALESWLENIRAQEELRIDDIRTDFQSLCSTSVKRLEEIKADIHGWLFHNKQQFQKPKSKALRFGGIVIGKLGFRIVGGGLKWKFSKKEDDQYIELLKRNSLCQYIRTVEVVDRDAIKKDIKANAIIPGVSVESGADEPFYEVYRTPELDNKS